MQMFLLFCNVFILYLCQILQDILQNNYNYGTHGLMEHICVRIDACYALFPPKYRAQYHATCMPCFATGQRLAVKCVDTNKC